MTKRPLATGGRPSTRAGVEPGRYFFVNGWRDTYEFGQDAMWHLQAPDINQEVYGVPQYVSALQSGQLNESATLFRRRYYYAGFILYMTDTASNVNDVDKLREAMRNSKGSYNFRKLFVYAPGGKKDGLHILPVSEIAAKDEFFNIKNCTCDDVLARASPAAAIAGDHAQQHRRIR